MLDCFCVVACVIGVNADTRFGQVNSFGIIEPFSVDGSPVISPSCSEQDAAEESKRLHQIVP
ncbi:MAG: hypothetical protein JWP08_4205, partial [Bryobacterales bacterium]|nr:hypothetical protein [Bryobacterales bacterium]